MAEQNRNFTSTLAKALFLSSIFIFGCSDNSSEKNRSTSPAKGTMPEVNISKAPVKPAATERKVATEEPSTDSAAIKATTETPAQDPPAAATPAAEPVSKGEQVYKSGCFACHATGVAGAPKFGDAALWKDRIAKGKDALVKNAIAGFTGTTGVMPPKGGLAHLSDEDIAAAVEYMMQAAQ